MQPSILISNEFKTFLYNFSIKINYLQSQWLYIIFFTPFLSINLDDSSYDTNINNVCPLSKKHISQQHWKKKFFKGLFQGKKLSQKTFTTLITISLTHIFHCFSNLCWHRCFLFFLQQMTVFVLTERTQPTESDKSDLGSWHQDDSLWDWGQVISSLWVSASSYVKW